MLVGDHLQGCFPHSRLPWNLPAVPGIFMGHQPTFDGTSCQAHQVAMSFIIIIYFFIFLLGHKDVAELLLENVANRDCRTKTGITPLFQVRIFKIKFIVCCLQEIKWSYIHDPASESVDTV